METLINNINKFDENIVNDPVLVQALANLGQRAGLKGDGMLYKKFYFSDLFDTFNKNEFTSNDYIGVIKTTDNNSNFIFGVVKKSDITPDSIKDEKLNILDGITLNPNNEIINSLNFDFSSTNVTSILPGSIFKSDYNGEYLSMMLFEQTADGSIEVQFNKFRLSDNILERAYKIIKLNSQQRDNEINYFIYDATRTLTNDNQYNLKTYLYQSSDINFNNLFNTQTYKNVISSNIDTYNLEQSPIFSIIKDYSSLDYIVTNESGTFQVNGTSEYIDLNKYINNYLTQDVNVYFEKLFTYYSHNYFSKDLSTLTQHIMLNLFNKIYEDSSASKKSNLLYVPLDYAINVVVNSNNQMKYYYSNDIFVTFTNLSKYNSNALLEYFNNSTKNTLIFNDIEENISIYNFNINYNVIYSDLVDSLTIIKKYSLPTISSKNTWIINGKETNISAVGENAGNPNIIIISNSNGNAECLVNSGAKFNWTDATIYYNDNIKVKLKVPEITDKNVYQFKYATVFNIDKDNDFISIWHYINDDGIFKFDYVRKTDNNENKYALNFLGKTIVNNKEDNDDKKENNDEIKQSLPVFKSNAKNSVLTKSADIKIYNKRANEYTQATDYKNDFNLKFKFDKLDNIFQDKKTTNQIYPIKDKLGEYYNEYVPNYNTASIDLSSVLLRDVTVVNKVNIVGYDSFGNKYYSYIGKSPTTGIPNNIITIGTSSTNINSDIESDNLNKVKELDVDLPVRINNKFTLSHTTQEIGNDIYVTSLYPICSNPTKLSTSIISESNILTQGFIEINTSTLLSDDKSLFSLLTSSGQHRVINPTGELKSLSEKISTDYNFGIILNVKQLFADLGLTLSTEANATKTFNSQNETTIHNNKYIILPNLQHKNIIVNVNKTWMYNQEIKVVYVLTSNVVTDYDITISNEDMYNIDATSIRG